MSLHKLKTQNNNHNNNMLKRLVVSQCINKKLLLWNQTWLKVNRIHLLMKIPTAHRQHWTEKLPHDCVHTSACVCVFRFTIHARKQPYTRYPSHFVWKVTRHTPAPLHAPAHARTHARSHTHEKARTRYPTL